MRFAIGLENIAVKYDNESNMLEQTDEVGLECVNDNMFYLELQDCNRALESINAEIGFLVNTGVSLTGTEAEDDTEGKTVNKDPLYKRIWEAVKKMFRTMRKWLSTIYTWIAGKFGRGGSEDASVIAEVEAQVETETVNIVMEEMTNDGVKIDTSANEEVSEEVVINKVAEVVKQAVKKVSIKPIKEGNQVANKVSPNSLNWIKPIIVKKVVEQIMPAVEVVEKADVKAVVVKPDKIGKYTFTLYLFESKKDSDKLWDIRTGSGKELEEMLASAKSNDARYNVNGLMDLYLKIISTIANNTKNCLNLLYDDVDIEDKPFDIINSYFKKTSTPIDDKNIEDLKNAIKVVSKSITEAKSKSHTVALKPHTFEVKTTNGKVDGTDYYTIIAANEAFVATKQVATYITQYANFIPKYMEEVISLIDKLDLTKEGATDTIKSAITFMKESSNDLRNIAGCLVNILGKSSIKKLRRTLNEATKFKSYRG